MQEVLLELNEKDHGAFVIKAGSEKLAEMIVAVTGNVLTVFHTESYIAEPKGMGGLLLSAMVAYAREHHQKVAPLCPYVHAQFKRHPELYNDVWLKESGDPSLSHQ
ncbi:MAG: GNAT family N-acetyltransferase [Ferruginibacter sp.]